MHFLVVQLSGLAVIVVGAFVLAEVGSYSYFLENQVLAPPLILIVAGAVVFFIAFLGCCGAIKENYYMLIAVSIIDNSRNLEILFSSLFLE